MDSLSSFWDALVAFGEALGSIGLRAMALGLGLHLVGLLLRAAAWRNIIKAGSRGEETPLAPVAGGLVAGVGVNGIVPAHAGDALKVYLIHKHLPATTYPMLASSLLPETLFNAMMAVVLLTWAWQANLLPATPDLPGISAFELSWAAQHPYWAAAIVLSVLGGLGALAVVHQHRLARVWHEVEEGVRILRSPGHYLRTVVSYQAAAWACRAVSAAFFLDAFGLDASLRNALTVVTVQGVGSVLPLTPSGVGPKQALLVVLFAGEASRSTILAFSVGMEVAIVAVQLAAAVVAVSLMTGGMRVRDATNHARQHLVERRGIGDRGTG